MSSATNYSFFLLSRVLSVLPVYRVCVCLKKNLNAPRFSVCVF